MADFDEAKERLAFEAYIKSKLKSEAEKAVLPTILARNDCGHYRESGTYLAWDAWLARARAQPSAPALSVETLAEQTGKTEGGTLRIGPYFLSRYIHGGIWIEAASGEGGQFNERDLAAVIEKFYNKNL